LNIRFHYENKNVNSEMTVLLCLCLRDDDADDADQMKMGEYLANNGHQKHTTTTILSFMKHHMPGTPWILVGLKSDLRDSEQAKVSKEEALKFAQEHQAVEYHECSTLTQQGLKNVFERAIILGLKDPIVATK
jgi:GTPase SAR1 family protein